MTWQAFYTPHTDDESIAMAGAIIQARENGDNVIVVLVTDNRPSTRALSCFQDIPDLHEARRDEWHRALDTLGVDVVRMWEVPEELAIVSPFEMQFIIEMRMRELHKELQPRMHHTVWGLNDVHVDSGNGSLVHGLCANALVRACLSDESMRGLLYAVYEYSKPLTCRRAPRVDRLDDNVFAVKRAALECYKKGNGSIGYGYRSVPELIDHAMEDPFEYMMEIP